MKIILHYNDLDPEVEKIITEWIEDRVINKLTPFLFRYVSKIEVIHGN